MEFLPCDIAHWKAAVAAWLYFPIVHDQEGHFVHVKFMAFVVQKLVAKSASPTVGGATDKLHDNLRQEFNMLDGTPNKKTKTKDEGPISIKSTDKNNKLNDFRLDVEGWVKNIQHFVPKDDAEHQCAKTLTRDRLGM